MTKKLNQEIKEIKDHEWYVIQIDYFKRIKNEYCKDYDDNLICDKIYQLGQAFFLYYKLNNEIPTYEQFIDYIRYKKII